MEESIHMLYSSQLPIVFPGSPRREADREKCAESFDKEKKKKKERMRCLETQDNGRISEG